MPAGLDASFWDAEKGAIKFEDLNKELATLRTAKAEWENARSVVPEAADKYEFPKDLKLPEGMSLNADDPRLPKVRKMAHEAGFSQKQFEALVQMDVAVKAAEVEQYNSALKAEREKLGPDGGKARVEAVTRALSANLGEGHAKHLVAMMVSAAQVQALEALIAKAGGQGAATAGYQPGTANANQKISEEDWAKLSPVEKFNYSRQKRA